MNKLSDERRTRREVSKSVVPCKLNNAKTNKTPWTIDELFKFRVNEFKPTKILEYIC